MSLTLRLRSEPPCIVDAEALRPDALAEAALHELARSPLVAGRACISLGDLFTIDGDASDADVRIEGDCSRLRGIGRGMACGRIIIDGQAGPHTGAEMRGGTIDVLGDAADWAGAEMSGGTMRIRGDAGNGLGGAYNGSRVGMRDGTIIVDGSVGADAGLAMRRGLIAIAGVAGAGLARGMIAGTILVAGAAANLPGLGMKRGTLVLLAEQSPRLAPSFVDSGRFRPPFLAIYTRKLRELGMKDLPDGRGLLVRRFNGDLVGGGQGEVLLPAAN